MLLVACGSPNKQAVKQDCRGGKAWLDEEAIRFAGCRVIVGDLSLGGSLITAQAFTALSQVSGTLTIGPSYQLNNLSQLSSLQMVNGALIVQENFRLSGLFLPALARVGGVVEIRGNGLLSNVAMPSLQSAGGLSVSSNHRLERLGVDNLKRVEGTVSISGKRLQDVLSGGIR